MHWQELQPLNIVASFCHCCFPKVSAWWVKVLISPQLICLLMLPLGGSPFHDLLPSDVSFIWWFPDVLVGCIRSGAIWDFIFYFLIFRKETSITLSNVNYHLVYFNWLVFRSFHLTYNLHCVSFGPKCFWAADKAKWVCIISLAVF